MVLGQSLLHNIILLYVFRIHNLLGHLQPSGEIEPHVDNNLYRESLEGGKEVYKRLQNVTDFAKCFGCTINGIWLKYFPNGSLRELIFRHRPPLMS